MGRRFAFTFPLLLGWASFFRLSSAGVGIDISPSLAGNPMTSTTASCLAAAGVDFAIVPSTFLNGTYDPNSAQTMAVLQSAGISQLGVSFTLCETGQQPQAQVNALVQSLNAAGVLNNAMGIWPLFMDFHVANCNWANRGTNCDYINGTAQALNLNALEYGFQWGLFSSNYSFNGLAGSGCVLTGPQGPVQVWYSDPDGAMSFADYAPFANVTSPSIKQYVVEDGMYAKCNFTGIINSDYIDD
jgi:hypothetical protein